MPFARAFLLQPLLLLVAAVSGCATKPMPAGGRYVITAPKSALYKYGPAQSFGADLTLSQGTIVTMLQSTWGFSHVMTETGVSGYVSTDDLKLAPPAPATPKPVLVSTTGSPQFYSGRPKQNTIRPTPGGPLFDVNDVPMPSGATDLPPPLPKPKFRY
jgi:hypothetical protein